MHIEDQVSGAIHEYADLLGGAPQVQLELRAMADHMGAFLVEALRLKQEWSVGTFCQGKLDDIDDEGPIRQDVAEALARHQRLDASEISQAMLNDCAVYRTIMTRLYTDWSEDAEPEFDDEDLTFLVEADGDPCVRPDACNWHDRGSEYVCGACGKAEAKGDGAVVFQDQ